MQALRVPVVVEAGFWARPADTVVVAEIPPQSPLGRVSRQGLANGSSLRVVQVAGETPVPSRPRFDASGRLGRIAFRLDQPIPALASARYWIVLNGTPSGIPAPGGRGAGAAELPWPEVDSQLMRERNGDFEAGGPKPAGWSLHRAALSTEDPHGGSRCVKLAYDGSDETSSKASINSATFPLLPNCRYTLRFWARGEKRSRDGSMPVASLTFLDADGQTVKTKPYRAHFGAKQPGTHWRQYALSESTPPETRFGRISISMWRASGTMWIDDVEVLEPVSARVAPPAVRVGARNEN
ncbi:MAG: hypothetical protein JXR37_34280 [Kiritimatiellae bacterium]|nr:hypothetical protein [Kiritimatiellia bacterium]